MNRVGERPASLFVRQPIPFSSRTCVSEAKRSNAKLAAEISMKLWDVFFLSLLFI